MKRSVLSTAPLSDGETRAIKRKLDDKGAGAVPLPPQMVRCQTLHCAKDIASQIAEMHRLFGACLRGEIENAPSLLDVNNPLAGSSGRRSIRRGPASTVVSCIRKALFIDEELRKRFGHYYVQPTAGEGAGTAYRGAMRIIAAAEAYEKECARQHSAAALWAEKNGHRPTLSLAGIRMLRRYRYRLVWVVRNECDTLYHNSRFVQRILRALMRPGILKDHPFDRATTRRIDERMSRIRIAAEVAHRRGGEDGCELERVAKSDMKLGSSAPLIVPGEWVRSTRRKN